MNLHLTEMSLKRSSHVECAENIRSSHVVKCECELRHIPSLKLLTANLVDILCIAVAWHALI